MKNLITVFLFLVCISINAQEPEHGSLIKNSNELSQVWNSNKSEWNDVEHFWKNFASESDAKYWGESDIYPKYSEVNEFDTLLIELEQGTCLMQFFHSRWRRANDVQRWDAAFNDYGSCPYVFD